MPELSLVTEGIVRLVPLITHTLLITHYAEGVELLRTKQAIKVLIDP